jgi:hypothetical protein
MVRWIVLKRDAVQKLIDDTARVLENSLVELPKYH